MKNQTIQSTNKTSQLFARGSLGVFHLLPSGAGGSQGVLGNFSKFAEKRGNSNLDLTVGVDT